MARTSTRRRKGCGLCKPWKHAGHGDAYRMPPSALRQFPAPNSSRISRHDASDPAGSAPPRARKDRNRWCRGKPGIEHVPVIVWRPYNSDTFWECRPARDYEKQTTDGWVCQHRQECANCGHVLRPIGMLTADECPDRAGTPASSGARGR